MLTLTVQANFTHHNTFQISHELVHLLLVPPAETFGVIFSCVLAFGWSAFDWFFECLFHLSDLVQKAGVHSLDEKEVRKFARVQPRNNRQVMEKLTS
jgi:hypothetical protein